MKLYYDLHMHSALSPCGDEEMTPNNIVHMSMIKGLELIAVTDHNSARNLPAVEKVAEECGILFLPGIEITSAEEVHLLGYFPDVETAVAFGEMIYDSLPDIQNRPDIFGRQCILDEQDRERGALAKLLINACPFGINSLCGMIRDRGGVAVPAHVNRPSNSLLANLGFIPEDSEFTAIEVCDQFPISGVDLLKYRVLYSSDAHIYTDIAERDHYLNCEPTRSGVLDKLRQISY